jgi:cytochrome c peroxidase
MRSAIVVLLVACGGHAPPQSGVDAAGTSPAVCQPIAPRVPVPFAPRSDGLAPLDSVAVPQPSGGDITDFTAAVRLGKALFWDVQVGGDGMTACATCHFSAGADARTMNTLSPGPNGRFESLGVTGPGQVAQVGVINSDDRYGSQGVLATTFEGLDPDPTHAADLCTPAPDPIFAGHRQVTGRNAPSVIGAALYRDLFWDGRASHVFNGVDPFGMTANAAMGTTAIDHAALASQAVGPPGNPVEMTCAGRTFAELGAKLLARTPLAQQTVSAEDGVLGCLAGASGGLVCGDHPCTYGELIAAAFGPQLAQNPAPSFARIFGQAIAAYESTLIPDRTPYDRFLRGDTIALTARQQEGFGVFNFDLNGCIHCHSGAELSDASASFAELHGLLNVDGGDQGFHDTGVRPSPSEDLGRAGLGPNHASFSVSGSSVDRAAFKTPQLRNVGLTAPYFHNGSKATLDDIMDFYEQGGDFDGTASDLHALILVPDQRQALIDFLQNGLTDCRVQMQRAPFDHPSLVVPDGPTVPAVGASGNGGCPP